MQYWDWQLQPPHVLSAEAEPCGTHAADTAILANIENMVYMFFLLKEISVNLHLSIEEGGCHFFYLSGIVPFQKKV